MKKINYTDCCNYIERECKIMLFPYQKDIIRGWCEGKEVRCCRGAGRSTLAHGFGKYIGKILDMNDYEADPEVIIPYFRVVASGLISEELVVQHAKEALTEDQFEREYCAKLKEEE